MPRTAELEMPPSVASPKPHARRWKVRSNRVVLDGITWKQYETILNALDERHIFITYDRGRMEIMTTGFRHEGGKKLLARLLELMAYERRISIVGAGNWTLKRRKTQHGLEPDECYYVANVALVRGRDDVDIRRDPPPDLAIEMEVSRRLGTRRAIYASLGVPELWCWNGETLTFLHLNSQGRYDERETSRGFPFLRAADLQRFLLMEHGATDIEIMDAFKHWLGALPPAGS